MYDEKKKSHQNLVEDTIQYQDEPYKGARQSYKDNGQSNVESIYCGGKFKISFWISENDLYKGLKKYGFIHIIKNNELSDMNHENGPAITLFASKKHIKKSLKKLELK